MDHNSAIDNASAALYRAAARYLDAGIAGADYSAVQAANDALATAVSAGYRAVDSARPAGRLAQDHPWNVTLTVLGNTIRTARIMTRPIVARAAALRDGRLAEHDAAVEVAQAAEDRRYASAAAEIDRREARMGRAMSPTDRDTIVRAYVGR